MIFDATHFDAMTGADPALQAEVLALFRAQAEAWRRDLIIVAPVQVWRDTAHTLKGSALGIGFPQLAAACVSAEALAKEHDAPTAKIEAALRAVHERLDEALGAIDALKLNPA